MQITVCELLSLPNFITNQCLTFFFYREHGILHKTNITPGKAYRDIIKAERQKDWKSQQFQHLQ